MTSRDRQANYISPRGLGAAQISFTAAAFQGAVPHTHHVPGRRAQHRPCLCQGVGVEGGRCYL